MLRMKRARVTSENRINMIFEKKNQAGVWDEYSITCSDRARPEFYEALKNLSPHVVEMCELPEGYLGRIKVRGVSFSYGGEKEVMGATITAQMKLNHSNCDLNLNTPHKASDSYSDSAPDENQLLSAHCIDALETLCGECELYINGDRAQSNLFVA